MELKSLPESAETLHEIMLNNGMEIYDMIMTVKQFIQTERNKIVLPSIDVKPRLRLDSSAKEARTYANELEAWEKGKRKFDRMKKTRNSVCPLAPSLIEGLIKIESGFFEHVPEKYQQKVYSLAYEHGHSSGMYEVYNYLCEMVDIFE